MSNKRGPLEALGIAIGDHIGSSYGSIGTREPIYRVESIWGPFWWSTDGSQVVIWPYPVISLGLSLLKDPRNKGLGINNIHQDGARWFTDQGDEITVVKTGKDNFYQTDLFSLVNDDPRKQPYVFDPDVDYSDQNHVFKCRDEKCLRDFNGKKWNNGHANPHCPYCRAWLSNAIIIMERVVPGKRYWSSYQRYLGFTGHPENHKQALDTE